MKLRPATPADAAAIAGLWNPIIRDTAITFNPVEKSAADIAALLVEKDAQDQPFLLAEKDGALLGFATYGQFRNGLGYRFSVEHTIILASAARGQGVGAQLMQAIEDHARQRGIHSIYAGVSSANPGAVRFHEKMGYQTLAVLPEVGFKFDRWLDLTLMQKSLSPADSDPATD